MGGHRGAAAEADVAYVRAALAAHGGAAVPDNFELTAPGPSEEGAPGRMPQAAQRSPQTLAFLELLGLPYNLDLAPAAKRTGGAAYAHGRAPGLGQPAGQGCAVAGAIPGQSCSGAGNCVSALVLVAACALCFYAQGYILTKLSCCSNCMCVA